MDSKPVSDNQVESGGEPSGAVMKLWLLSAAEWGGYDSFDAHVVRAVSEERARQLAAESPGDEGREVWLNLSSSTCIELNAAGDEGFVLSSFNAG